MSEKLKIQAIEQEKRLRVLRKHQITVMNIKIGNS